MTDVSAKAAMAKEISLFLAKCSTELKNRGLLAMAERLVGDKQVILDANKADISQGHKDKMSATLLDRLTLTQERIVAMADGLREIARLPDPVGEVMEGWIRPNGLQIIKKRVPIGVIGIIYEARPNVTVDAIGLTLKSSNAVILRGSSSTLHSNQAIVKVLSEALFSVGFPSQTIQLITDPSRDTVAELVTCNQFVDLVIPRGGATLIQSVIQISTVPCIETGVGNCHVYVDKDARPEIVVPIVLNAKAQRPSVCNAAETLLVHAEVAERYLPDLLQALRKEKVEIVGCEVTRGIDPAIQLASEGDYATEFLDYKIAVKVVKDVREAIEHISRFGTQHTEAILSENISAIEAFKTEVDAAAIMINTSTRFTDGFEFGFGAEIGISTQKMHARGPMGLRELTTYKYIVQGNGQIRE